MVNIESKIFRFVRDNIDREIIESPVVKIDDYTISVDDYAMEVVIKKQFLNVYKEFRLIYQLSTKYIKSIKYEYADDERIKAMIVTTK